MTIVETVGRWTYAQESSEKRSNLIWALTIKVLIHHEQIASLLILV